MSEGWGVRFKREVVRAILPAKSAPDTGRIARATAGLLPSLQRELREIDCGDGLACGVFFMAGVVGDEGAFV